MNQQPRLNYQDMGLDELVIYTQQGHQEAFRYIVQQCNQRLFRVAISVLNNDHDAQDALQNAYLNAYQKIHTFKGDALFTTWITRIVLNECYQLLRKQKPNVELSAAEIPSQVIPFPNRSNAMTDPIAHTSNAEMRHLLERTISTLPPKYRTVLMLRDIEQFSTAETAQLLDLTVETVKTQLHRARQQLKEKLSQHMNDSLEDTFLFLGDRCAQLTESVMQKIQQLPENR